MQQNFGVQNLRISFDMDEPQIIKQVEIDLTDSVPGLKQDVTSLVVQSPRATELIESYILKYLRTIEDDARDDCSELATFKILYSNGKIDS